MPTLSRLEQQSLNILLSLEAKYSRQIQKQLSDALITILGEMKKLYDKYSIAGKLTRAEMTKYNKYSTMEKQIIDKLDPALKKNIETIKHLLPRQFQESFFQYAWAIDQATGLRLSWGLVNTKQLLGAFDITNPKNIELINALKNYSIEAKKRVRAALLNGLSLGKSYNKMAKDLETTVTATYKRCLMTIRTEGQTAINAGQSLAYLRAQENGIDGTQVWTSTKDGHTRYDHGRMDGAKRISNDKQDGWINVDGGFTPGPGGEYAPYPAYAGLSAGERIHCRCGLRFEIDGYSPQLMRTREEGILPYQNYTSYTEQYHPEWLKNK